MKLRHLAVGMLLAACASGAGETTLGTTTTQPETTTAEPPTTTEQPPDTTTPTTTAAVTTSTAPPSLIGVEGGDKVEGPDTISVAQGEVVSFQVMTDVVDEVHVHGYDLFFETVPGEPIVVEFTADATGIFEVELEGNHLELVKIEVTP